MSLDEGRVHDTAEALAAVLAAGGGLGGALKIQVDPATLLPLLVAQTNLVRDDLAGLSVANNAAAFEQVRTDIAGMRGALPQQVADLIAIPAPVSIQPLLDAQRDQILSGIPATPSNASAFAQVRADIAQIPGRIVIPQPAPWPDLTPDLNELKSMLLAQAITQNTLQQNLATVLALLGSTPQPPANQPPVVSLTATELTGQGKVSLSVIATDPDGTITKVEIWRNGVLIATITTRTLGAYVYTDSGLAPNQYSYVAKAYDNATPAAVTSSSTSLITVSPVIVEPPVPDFTMTVSALALTDPGVILLTASPPILTTRRVEFYKDDGLVAIWEPLQLEYSLNNVVLLSQYGLAQGTYQYQSKAYNGNGTITMSAKVPVTIGARSGPVQYIADTRTIGPYDPNAAVYAYAPQDPGLPGDIVLPLQVNMIPLI